MCSRRCTFPSIIIMPQVKLLKRYGVEGGNVNMSSVFRNISVTPKDFLAISLSLSVEAAPVFPRPKRQLLVVETLEQKSAEKARKGQAHGGPSPTTPLFTPEVENPLRAA